MCVTHIFSPAFAFFSVLTAALLVQPCLSSYNSMEELIAEFADNDNCDTFISFIRALNVDNTCLVPIDQEMLTKVDGLSDDTIDLSSCGRNGITEETCSMIRNFVTQCSCTNLDCYGWDMVRTLTTMGSATNRASCDKLITQACITHKQVQRGACQAIETSLKNALKSTDSNEIFEQCPDMCTPGGAIRQSLPSRFRASLVACLSLISILLINN